MDTDVGHLAARYGHNCIVKIPPCHQLCTKGKMIPMDKETLDEATNIVLRTGNYLGKTVTSPITMQYLQRNYYIVEPASQVLALSYFDQYKKTCTGWNRMEHGNGATDEKTCFCF